MIPKWFAAATFSLFAHLGYIEKLLRGELALQVGTVQIAFVQGMPLCRRRSC